MKITTVLFDFDGVISNTEPEYDRFYEDFDKKYNLNVPDFAAQIKGKQLPEALKNFPEISDELKNFILKETAFFESQMNFPLVPGIIEFIDYLKHNKYKIGLVTSSPNVKMKVALQKLKLERTFDTVVTSDRICTGKPNPMSYLTASKDLHSLPDECIVFEDSLAGIEAGLNAGMKVVGVATTLNKKEVLSMTDHSIYNFSDLDKLKSYLNII